jgi:hypothetical protein
MAPKREVRRLPTRHNITEFKYSGRKYSRRKVTQIEQQIKTRFPGKRFQILLPYESWKPGSWTGSSEDTSLFSLLDYYDESQMPSDGGDPDYFDQFIVYMMDPPVLASGCNPKREQSLQAESNGLNDCLYHCLYHAYGTFSRMPKNIEKPELLKQALGLPRDAPIPVSCIEKVERLAKSIAINITGDATRISNSSAYRRITLILTNGHYSITYNPDRKHTDPATTKPKLPIIYQEDGINNKVMLYDGKTIHSIIIPEFRKLQAKALFGKYSYIPIDRKIKETLDEAYVRINEERDTFWQESKKIGLALDLFMHNGSYKKTALWLFERLSQAIPASKPLDPIEAKWISDTMMGGIIWAEKEWKGFGRQYDETSLYPSIQQSALTFPINRGRFQVLKDFINHRGFNLYGIYRAEVEYKEDMKRVFRYNYHKKYTHIDLSHARELGLQVTLIQDGTPNALVYEKETRIPGNVIFGEYVHFLFKLKNLGGTASRVAKKVLNTLWGALCQRNKSYHDICSENGIFDFPEGEMLESIMPIGGESQWILQFSSPGNLFKGEYPRIAPFLLAQGRKIISQNIQPYTDKIRRIHTDGFILEEDPNQLPLITCSEDAPKTLGALKYEKEGECYVKNANQVAWI